MLNIMNTKIGARITNVEAALIQVVGTEATTACDSCQKEHGPFSHCVTAAGALECRTCHFGGITSHCTLPRLGRSAVLLECRKLELLSGGKPTSS